MFLLISKLVKLLLLATKKSNLIFLLTSSFVKKLLEHLKEYKFTLLKYKQNVQQSPFTNIGSTSDIQSAMGCQQNYDLVSVKKPTKNFDYQVHVFYGPEDPIEGCEMQWLIKFISKYDFVCLSFII